MSETLRFPPVELPPEAEALRVEVRRFLHEQRAAQKFAPSFEGWSGFAPEFSRAMGERGWIGMTWPREYGGHERSALERYVVLEEMLAAGAPVARALDRRPAVRPVDPALRHRGAEDAPTCRASRAANAFSASA